MTKPLPKILFFVHLPPPLHGVSLINQQILTSALVKKTLSYDLIPIRVSTQIEQIANFTLQKLKYTMRLFFKLIYTISSTHPRYVYCSPSPTGKAFYRDVGFILTIKLLRKELILHLHGQGIEKKQHHWLGRLLCRLIFKNTYVIHLTPKMLEQEIVWLNLPKDKCFIVENGVPDCLTRNNVNKTPLPRLLFFSNRHPTKGIKVLLQAALILIKINKGNFRLDLVGNVFNKSFEEEIKAFIHHNHLEKYVFVHGPAEGKEKIEWFSQADIFVHPSLNETHPLVILEAMSFELPVVSTIEGGIPETVLDQVTGLLVEKNNPEVLANAIQRLLLSPELRETMGKAGRKRFEDFYTVEHFENRLVNVFSTILNEQ